MAYLKINIITNCFFFLFEKDKREHPCGKINSFCFIFYVAKCNLGKVKIKAKLVEDLSLTVVCRLPHSACDTMKSGHKGFTPALDWHGTLPVPQHISAVSS